jgi:hypothetical protein
MSNRSIMPRLRRANPVPQAPEADADDLFARITALPADPRLEAPRRQPPARRRRAPVLVFAAFALAALLASTAFAVSRWIADDVVEPPVTKQEYLDAQAQLTLPPGAEWPTFDLAPLANSVTSRGAGGGHAVMIAMNAWECHWARAIRRGDQAAERRAHDELNALLASNVYEAPPGAPEGWTPTPMPTVPFAVFANDGGLGWVRATYEQAAAGDPRNLIQSCRANAPE